MCRRKAVYEEASGQYGAAELNNELEGKYSLIGRMS
jgi:hypothetical protein